MLAVIPAQKIFKFWIFLFSFQNAITHKKINGDGPSSLTFQWQAPPDLAANVQFRATVALNGGVFWVGVLSNPVSVY